MVSITKKILYGSGGAVYATKEAAYTMFVLLYFTQVLGLSGALTGLIISLSLLWDAVSDPLVGAWSDKWRSPMGRRRPFMIIAVFPAGIGFVGLFSPPQVIIDHPTYLASWLLFWSFWVRTAVTLFSIPHLAQSTDLTRDYNERSRVLGARMAVIFFASVILPAVALTTIFSEQAGVDGRFVATNYIYYGVMSCILVWITGSLSCCLSTPEATKHHTTGGVIRSFLRTLGNRNFRALLAYDISATISYGVIVSLNMLAWIYYWEFSAEQISLILAGPSLVAIILVMLSLNTWLKRFEKAQIVRIALACMILDGAWLYPGRMLGLLPENGTSLVLWLNLLFMLIFMYFFLLRAIMSQSIAADIADEHDYHHGERQEGSFFAALNFSTKVASVLGPAYGGLVLDWIGLSRDTSPGEVAEPVLSGLATWYMAGAGVPLLFAFAATLGITLTRVKLASMQAGLSTSDSQSAP